MSVRIIGPKAEAEGLSGFLPVFRSGSYSDIGPKPYMEDEHICIDNLRDYVVLLSPGAFYGVCNLTVSYS